MLFFQIIGAFLALAVLNIPLFIILRKKKKLGLKWNEPFPLSVFDPRIIKKVLQTLTVIGIVIVVGVAIKHFSEYQFNGDRRSSSSGSSSSGSSSYEHSCGHCSKGFNGGGYIGSYPDIIKVSSSEIESFPAHYCSKRCAIAD